jgi:hydroxymethylpyrimidine pyrophosphatase-like HAD family hydrolase
VNSFGATKLLKSLGIDTAKETIIEDFYCKWKEGAVDDNSAWGFYKQREEVVTALLQGCDSLGGRKKLARVRQIIQEIESREGQAPENPANKNNPEIQEWENHHLAQMWKNENKILFAAMQKAINIRLVIFTGCHFDFNCDKGCVGLFFKEAGYTEYKHLNSIVLIKGEKPKNTTLQNATSNAPPVQWEKIKNQIFGNNDKTMTKY